jgi:UMF1 family MFS transporter
MSWCLFDWANSSFPTNVITFIFAAYFIQFVAENPIIGTGQWGLMQSFAALFVAFLSPILGSIADHSGHQKKWLFFCTLVCIGSVFMLGDIRPNSSQIFLALSLVFLGILGFEFGMVFYNSFLAKISPPGMIGIVSGFGWGFGYFGGLASLYLIYTLFVTPNAFQAEHIPNMMPVMSFVACWFLLFSLPFFFFVKESVLKTRLKISRSFLEGIRSFVSFIFTLKKYKQILLFLLARMLYADGLATLFIFGGIFASTVFSLQIGEIIIFGILINITAGIGSLAFSFLDMKFGSKKVILVSLAFLICLCVLLFFSTNEKSFWLLGVPLGFFIGPVQASSRALLAKMAPRKMSTRFFGIFAFSGKATSFLGPALVAWVTIYFDNARAGMIVIIVFLVLGYLLLSRVKKLNSANA